MKRKMLDEEKALRKWATKAYLPPRFNMTAFYRDITALVRACYEDAEKRAVCGKCRVKIAAAIREGGK